MWQQENTTGIGMQAIIPLQIMGYQLCNAVRNGYLPCKYNKSLTAGTERLLKGNCGICHIGKSIIREMPSYVE